MPDIVTAKALREQRHELAKEIRRQADKVNAENRDFSAEEKPAWEKVNADYDALSQRIAVAERAEKVDAEQSARRDDGGPGREDRDPRKGGKTRVAPADSKEQRALALQAWFRRQSGLDLDKRHVSACKALGVNPGRRSYSIKLGRDYRQIRHRCRAAAAAQRGEARALSALQQDKGAYMIPEGFMDSLETALLAYCPVREIADVIRTDTGEDMPWPTANDTTNKGALLSESTTVPTNADPSLGQVVLHAYMYTSKMILVPYGLLRDSAFDLETWLGDLLGTRLGRIQADDFTTGSGAAKPTGIVTAAALGVTAASATAITADEIYGLKHSVDPAYRQGAGFMFHDNVLLYVKKLKDSQNRYLWQSGIAVGAPDTFDGDPITINQSMASSIATTNKTMLYGQMSKFKVRDVEGVRLKRLDERFADTDQVAFVAFQACDSNLIDAGTKPVKYLQQA